MDHEFTELYTNIELLMKQKMKAHEITIYAAENSLMASSAQEAEDTKYEAQAESFAAQSLYHAVNNYRGVIFGRLCNDITKPEDLIQKIKDILKTYCDKNEIVEFNKININDINFSDLCEALFTSFKDCIININDCPIHGRDRATCTFGTRLVPLHIFMNDIRKHGTENIKYVSISFVNY